MELVYIDRLLHQALYSICVHNIKHHFKNTTIASSVNLDLTKGITWFSG